MGERMVRAMEDVITGRLFYLTGPDGSSCPGVNGVEPAQYGWKLSGPPGSTTLQWVPMVPQSIGRVSDDGQVVLITNDGLRRVRNAAAIGNLTADAVQDYLAALVVDGTKPGGEVPKKYRFGRTKGFLFDAWRIGLADPPATAHTASAPVEQPEVAWDSEEPF